MIDLVFSRLASGGSSAPCWKRGLRRPRSEHLPKTLACRTGINRPPRACLHGFHDGTTITREKLSRVEQAEATLFREGFRQFRVRDHGDIARLELDDDGLGGFTRQRSPKRRHSKIEGSGIPVRDGRSGRISAGKRVTISELPSITTILTSRLLLTRPAAPTN